MASILENLLFVFLSFVACILVSFTKTYQLTNIVGTGISNIISKYFKKNISFSTISSDIPTPFGILLHSFVMVMLILLLYSVLINKGKENYKYDINKKYKKN